MSDNELAIIETRETIYFGHDHDALRQWILVTIQNSSPEAVPAGVAIEAHGEQVITRLRLAPGVREYRCFAPVLWPDRPPEPEAPVLLTAGGRAVASTTSVGTHRPWTIYLLSDTCTDYAWVYEDVDAVHADDAAITEAEIVQAEATRGAPGPDRNHYNFVHAREVEFYLEQYPDQSERLFQHIREGTLTLNPIYNMCLTGAMSLEELIRQLYPARTWAETHGLDIGYANHQETPTIAWAMVPVLLGSGVDHLVKSVLPYECPWAERLEEPPVYRWEGPDGGQILVRLRKKDYVEGRFVLRDRRATDTALHDEIIPRYEGMGGEYPFNAIALVGCYGDLAPESWKLPAKKVATIIAYNAQGWEYPRLINASHQQFWDDLQDQIANRDVLVPVFRGDYGTSWEAWPACLAYDFARWRRAQQWAAMADTMAAVQAHLDRSWHETTKARLTEGWRNLVYLADHAWNGANDSNRLLNASLRRGWQTDANRAFEAVVADGLAALAGRVSTGVGNAVLAFNTLGWPRSGVVQLARAEAGARVVDQASGNALPTQAAETDGGTVLYAQVADVPSVGYRVIAVQAPQAEVKPEPGPWQAGEQSLEGPFYRVEISPVTGGIVSLVDKIRGRELVDSHSSYHLNQCLYWSEGSEHTPLTATVELGPQGPVFGQLIVRSELKNTHVETTITLYAGLDRVDIRNELDKEPTGEQQELDFAFPFNVPDRRYRYEAPGAIIEPDVDQRPGAGQAYTVVRHFVDIFNDEFGVTFSQADSGIVEFGHRTTDEDPTRPDPDNSTLLALALENRIDWHESIRDQAGVRHFVFRYSLCGHDGGFDPVAAVRFGSEDNSPLLSVPLPAGQQGDLPGDRHSFIQVAPDSAVPTTIKVAEEEGLVVRLWECAGRDVEAQITIDGLGTLAKAWNTDLLERDGQVLSTSGQETSVRLPACGLATARLLLT